MQTFVPFPNLMMSVGCLDDKRLGKQRVECKQIYKALTVAEYGWKNHPAVKMWSGHLESLAYYGWLCCTEWKNRGFSDSMTDWFVERGRFDAPLPEWWGGIIHYTHCCNLFRKDPKYYVRFFPDADPTVDYYWPAC